MKKNIKRTLSTMMAAAMLASCAGVVNMVANAADVTINHGTSSDEAHTHKYEAYQIFKGTLSGGVLTDIKWGEGVNASKLVGDINAAKIFSDTITYNASSPDESAQKLADKISSLDDNSPEMFKLSKIIAGCINSSKAIPEKADESNVINFSSVGYYLIQDVSGYPKPDDQNDTTNYAPTAYIMKVINNGVTNISAKADTPTIEKSIVTKKSDGTPDLVAFNTASIGDIIQYRFDTAVPEMKGYDKYYFIIYDALDKGITFNNDISIKVGTKDLVKDTDYKVYTDFDDNSLDDPNTTRKENIKIVFYDFIQYRNTQPSADIVVTYTGTLNSDANIGSVGNENSVFLKYSNNPNFTGNGNGQPGKPNEPGDGEPTGTTPEHKVKTYTTALRIKKVDEEGNSLEGARFKIEGDGIKSATVVSKDTFVEAANGEYYKLTSGFYTKTEPTEQTKNKYVTNDGGGYPKYTLNSTTEEQVVKPNADKFYVEAEVSADGFLYLKGLNQGTYKITETKAPGGYNSIAPFNINIKATASLDKCTWTVDGANIVDGEVAVKVVNTQGSKLPETGGIGTTIFYVGGSFLILGAAGLFINKKRKGEKSE